MFYDSFMGLASYSSRRYASNKKESCGDVELSVLFCSELQALHNGT